MFLPLSMRLLRPPLGQKTWRTCKQAWLLWLVANHQPYPMKAHQRRRTTYLPFLEDTLLPFGSWCCVPWASFTVTSRKVMARLSLPIPAKESHICSPALLDRYRCAKPGLSSPPGLAKHSGGRATRPTVGDAKPVQQLGARRESPIVGTGRASDFGGISFC